MGKEDFEA